MALRPADKSNNFRAQENPSHTAIATSPANASAIKYAVMSFSLDLDQSCGMIACAIISGANPVSSNGSRVRTWTWATPRADAFARAGQ